MRSFIRQTRGLNKESLALVCFAALALLAAYQVALSYNLATRGVALDGVHASERSGNRVFRWTDGHALIRFEGVGRQTYRVALTLSGSRPNNAALPEVRVLGNGKLLGAFSATRGLQEYAFDVPAETIGAGGSLELRIESETFVPPNDLRTLGVALYDARVEPVSGAGGLTYPPLVLFIWVMVVVVAVYRVMGGAWRASALAIGFICLGVASERVWTAVALPWVALLAATVYAGALIKQRASWRETAAALAVCLSSLRFVLDFLNLFRISRFTDVVTMFEAAQKLAQGIDPYDYAIVRENPLYQHSYVYPPPFAQFLALFLPLGFDGAIVAWVALNFALYFVVIWGLLRVFELRWRSAGMYAFLLVAFNYRPVIDTLYGGQLDVLILALLLTALWLAQRNRMGASGAALACAALTKLHPLLIAPFYLAPRRWRGLMGMGLTLIIVVVISMLFVSPGLYERYVTVVLPGRGGEGTGNPENQSVSGFFYRAHGVLWSDIATPAQAESIRRWSYGVSLLLALATFGALWHSLRGRHGAEHERVTAGLHFASLITLMLLVLPTSWMHYETQLLLPLAVMLSYALVARRREVSSLTRGGAENWGLSARRRALLVVWGVAGALTAFANQEIFRGGEFDAGLLTLAQSYKFYAVLLLWGGLIWAQTRKDDDATGDGHGSNVQRAREHRSASRANPATAD